MFRFFENLVDPFAAYTESDVPPRKLWPFLWAYCRPFKAVFAATALLSVIVAALDVVLIWYVGRMVDLLASGAPAAVWAEHGTEFILAGLAIVFLRPVLAGADVALLHNTILPNFGTLIRWRAHRHVLRQPVGWFENDFAGRIANRIMQTPPAAGDAVFQTFDAVAFAVTTVIGSIALLAGSDPRLVVPLLLWLLGYGLLLRWTIRRAGPAAKASSDARSAITGRVVDSYSNIHSVKLFAHHDREITYARDAIEHARTTFQKEMRIITTMDVVLTLLNGLLIVGVTGWAVVLWYQGSASVGVVAAAAALVLRLNNMTYWVMWATTGLVQALGVVAEGMETIAQPIALTDAPDAKPLNLTEGRIEVQGLSHHYGRGSGGLDRISLSIAPGEKVGLIGRSGAGKSTLVKLLLRFYDAEGGRILIDGQDIAQVTQDSLRARIGMVQQDSSLLHRSVRENILYGRPDATEAEMIEAAQRAEAHDFILTLRDPEGRAGYDAQVGERGVKLSGGQRQRVALARVILKDAPILVLDEATSALDSEVEAAIQDTLYGVMEGKTVIAIAHRLSTIAHMDRIVVIEDGRIAEQGSHGELLASGGLYARFWERQSGGFIGTEDAAE
ncbi:ATP-binding cassette domain-containing protein [Frigidibacter albus]|uniref:ATP-binding cassette domain-containing protein n=1 Tax=Frigidibacter albus TaxID=1465486 RepID=A0A6L8VIQ2_9RHOB|nr:ABC transporter ATP-binding protein [Frigidibacter albus]MZQ89576.1 ATP-binding cassette domain-containing protein [Frigidibacter albus]NBE31482.1 ATP-binding cassette domain-containing protein [Frigidibacter albus]GGH55247.1 multidrug ABC transporter ATP-binding protein [Frigidibacter albus]